MAFDYWAFLPRVWVGYYTTDELHARTHLHTYSSYLSGACLLFFLFCLYIYIYAHHCCRPLIGKGGEQGCLLSCFAWPACGTGCSDTFFWATSSLNILFSIWSLAEGFLGSSKVTFAHILHMSLLSIGPWHGMAWHAMNGMDQYMMTMTAHDVMG